MAVKRTNIIPGLGLEDPRDVLKKDMVRMYSDYILGGKAKPVQSARPAASSQPGWGEPIELEDEMEEEEISPDKGQLVEFEEDEEEDMPALEPEVSEEELSAEEEIDAGLTDVPAAPRKNVYEDELLALLEKAKANLEAPKKLSVADILGAGTMRRSAELIRKTEQENEKRRQTAQELAIDILTRKSGSEEKRRAEESLADYRNRVLELRRIAALRKPKDPVEERNKRDAMARFPNLSPEQAYQKFMELKYPGRTPPAPPKPALITRMAQLAIKRDEGTATPVELRELQMYEDQQKRNTSILDILIQRQAGQ